MAVLGCAHHVILARPRALEDGMAFAWMTWYDLTDEQYKEMLAERDTKVKSATQQQQQQ